MNFIATPKQYGYTYTTTDLVTAAIPAVKQIDAATIKPHTIALSRIRDRN